MLTRFLKEKKCDYPTPTNKFLNKEKINEAFSAIQHFLMNQSKDDF